MDETRGTLYWNILQIIEKRKPKVVLLENVRNLAGPRHLHEWQVIIETLRDQGYRVSETPAIFSPHLLPPERGGRPQVRERVFITATHNPTGSGDDLDVEPVALPSDTIDGFDPKDEWHLEDLLDDTHNIPGCDLTDSERLWIDAWDEWVETWYEATEGRRPPGFPIWADSWTDYRQRSSRDFGFVPDYRDLMEPTRPADVEGGPPRQELRPLRRAPRTGSTRGPRSGASTRTRSRRRGASLEWQAQDTPRLWDTVMHFRPSGIRAKRPTYLPALVAITQTSIVGPRERRLSPRETARLQGLPDWFDFGDQRPAATYKQMGNGVNVGAVWHVLREHVAPRRGRAEADGSRAADPRGRADGAAVARRVARALWALAVAALRSTPSRSGSCRCSVFLIMTLSARGGAVGLLALGKLPSTTPKLAWLTSRIFICTKRTASLNRSGVRERVVALASSDVARPIASTRSTRSSRGRRCRARARSRARR